MKVMTTRTGLRLSQHGVVLSELRTAAGPTHSVFDVLAALAAMAGGERRALLGFAGGGMMAPWHSAGGRGRWQAVDLDERGWKLFRQHCPAWAEQVDWERADAVAWLRRQRKKFDLIVEDLSVPVDGDVFKPAVSWAPLPAVIAARLRRGGAAVFNLMPQPDGRWQPELGRLLQHFPAARVVVLEDFQNHLVLAGAAVAPARTLGRQLRAMLRAMRSRQAERIQVRDARLCPG